LLREKQQVSLLSAQLLKEIEVRPGEVVVMHHDVQESLATPEQNCMRHIVVADLDNAKRLLAELKGGADFAELARQNSTDSTSVKNGGDVGCFEREHLVPLSEFERAVYNSNVNELTGPVSDGTAYHLLIIYKRKIASAPDLNEVYDQLENEIRHERLPDKLIQIRDASGVATYPERLDG
jgi:parvulin-like peptidyl-prolyl isomerase